MPRRSHKKSRDGCQRCKSRKIKCDETRPSCGKCVKHNALCDFEHPEVIASLRGAATASSTCPPASIRPRQRSARPAHEPTNSSARRDLDIYRAPAHPLLSSTSAVNRLLELRLMHFFTTVTAGTINISSVFHKTPDNIWSVAVPHIAFNDAPFLLDAILAVAAVHLRGRDGDSDKELIKASHVYTSASLAAYQASLKEGIGAHNAEALFLTAVLIGFQSIAARAFVVDDLPRSQPASLSTWWLHSYQGLKAIAASAWKHLSHSQTVCALINKQPPPLLEYDALEHSFFGRLLNGLDDEICTLDSPSYPTAMAHQQQLRFRRLDIDALGTVAPDDCYLSDKAAETHYAYCHAIAFLNWVHKVPRQGGLINFPSTVSRRFVDLVEERRPRALVIVACFFALFRTLDDLWWIHGLAKREVLTIHSLFVSGALGPDAYATWSEHLSWPIRIALWDDANGAIPTNIWGADWLIEEVRYRQESAKRPTTFEVVGSMTSAEEPLPDVPEELKRLTLRRTSPK